MFVQIRKSIIIILLILISSLASSQVKEYFINCDPEDFTYIYENFNEDIYIPISITYNGTTWTDADMRIRGDGSRYLPKKSLKVRFNGEPFVNGRDKLNFNAEYEDRSYIRAFVSSRVFKMAGQKCFDTDFARLFLNGDFLGLYQMTENMDEFFLEANGYDPNGSLFKATKDGACLSIYDDLTNFWEQKTGSGNKEDLALLIEEINQVSVDEYPAFCSESLDYNQVVNMIACNMVLSNQSTYYHNYYMYRDANGNGKWEMLPWDLDKTFSVYSWRNYTYGSAPWTPDNPYFKKAILNPAMMNDIEVRANEIFDQVFTTDILWPMIDSLVTVLQPSVEQDTTDDIQNVDEWLNQVQTEKGYIANFPSQLNWFFDHVQTSFTAELTPDPLPPDVTFNWSPSTDPDGLPIEYRFLLTSGTQFEPELTTVYEGLTSTTLTLQNIEPGDYFWQVVSVDADGQEVESFDSRNPLEIRETQILPCVIEEDLELTMEESPYLINCDILVLAGIKLTISEGVEIVFTDDYAFRILGEVEATGTSQNPVIFRPESGQPYWDIIKMENASGHCKFRYVQFFNGRLDAINSTVLLENVYLENTRNLNYWDALFQTTYGHITVRESSFISNNTGEGLIFSLPESALVEDSYFYQTPDAIEYLHYVGGMVRNNVIINCHDDGIDFDNVYNATIENNVIFNSFDNGITLDTCMNITVKNNLVFGCTQGINLKNNAHALLINNTLYQNGNSIWLYEKYAGSGGGHATILNTIISQTTGLVFNADKFSSWTIDYSLCDTEEIEGTANLFSDPGFVAAADSNFTLLPTSPCIDKGDPNSVHDPDGTRADMGAYFYNQGTFDVLFNEINYKSSPDFYTEDWVELYNNDDSPADLSGWVFKDSDDNHSFEFPYGTVIGVHEYLVLCSDMGLFSQMNPEIENVVGNFTFGLNSSGEAIRLYNNTGALIDSVEYGTEFPWPVAPNGNGPTLELRNPSLDNSLAENWCASIDYGTPDKINSCFETAIAESEAKPFSVNVYPNPTYGPAYLDFNSKLGGDMDINVFNNKGNLCKTYNKEVAGQVQYKIEIDDFPGPGMYLVHFILHAGRQSYQQQTKLLVIE
jgi:parallel beta-helix repeat protein